MSSLRSRGGIFISYRREETAANAGRLYDLLSDHFGEARVFMDIDSIVVGVDFTRAVIEAVSGCNILLALIGRDWLTITDSKGRRRIDNPNDWVRIEIETALQRDIRVVPVLVDGAVLPQADDLPPSLQPLVKRHALELSYTGFRSEVTRLITAVNEVLDAETDRSAKAPKTSSRASVTQQGRWKLEQIRFNAVRLSSGVENHDIFFVGGPIREKIWVDGQLAVETLSILPRYYPLRTLSATIGSDVSIWIEKRTLGARWLGAKTIIIKIDNEVLRQELKLQL
jgi:TIR domain